METNFDLDSESGFFVLFRNFLTGNHVLELMKMSKWLLKLEFMDVWLMINSFHFCRFWELNAKIGRGHATSKEVAWMIDAFIALTWLSNRLSKVNLKSILFTTAYVKIIKLKCLTILYFYFRIFKMRIMKSLKNPKLSCLFLKNLIVTSAHSCVNFARFFHALIPLHYVWKTTKKSHFTKLQATLVTLFWLQLKRI